MSLKLYKNSECAKCGTYERLLAVKWEGSAEEGREVIVCRRCFEAEGSGLYHDQEDAAKKYKKTKETT